VLRARIGAGDLRLRDPGATVPTAHSRARAHRRDRLSEETGVITATPHGNVVPLLRQAMMG
jgi:hypothetical protein